MNTPINKSGPIDPDDIFDDDSFADIYDDILLDMFNTEESEEMDQLIEKLFGEEDEKKESTDDAYERAMKGI